MLDHGPVVNQELDLRRKTIVENTNNVVHLYRQEFLRGCVIWGFRFPTNNLPPQSRRRRQPNLEACGRSCPRGLWQHRSPPGSGRRAGDPSDRPNSARSDPPYPSGTERLLEKSTKTRQHNKAPIQVLISCFFYSYPEPVKIPQSPGVPLRRPSSEETDPVCQPCWRLHRVLEAGPRSKRHRSQSVTVISFILRVPELI